MFMGTLHQPGIIQHTMFTYQLQSIRKGDVGIWRAFEYTL
jgi:hypothetical protein